jgi:WD40 repeat protein
MDPALFGSWVPRIKYERVERVGSFSQNAVLTVSLDGKQMAWLGHDGQAKVYSPRLQTIATVSLTQPGAIVRCTFSDDGELLAIQSDSGDRIEVLYTRDFSLACQILLEGPIRSFSFWGGTNQLLVRHNNTFSCFDALNGKQITEPSDLPPMAAWWQFSQDNRHMIVARTDGKVWLWDRLTKAPLSLLAEQARQFAASFSPDGLRVAALTSTSTSSDAANAELDLRIWDVKTGKLKAKLAPCDIAWRAARFDPPKWTAEGKFLLAASRPDAFGKGAAIHMWSSKSGSHVADFIGPRFINGFGLAGDSRVLAAGSATGEVVIWDFATALDRIAVDTD